MDIDETYEYLLSKAPPISRIAPSNLVGLWEDLVLAKHGLNGYGGTIAQIYAYRLGYHRHEGADRLNAASAIDAARSLHALLEWFESDRDVRITVEGRALGNWLTTTQFDHRFEVGVIC